MFGFFKDSKQDLLNKNYQIAFTFIPKVAERHKNGGAPIEALWDSSAMNEYLKLSGAGRYKTKTNIPFVKPGTLEENPNILVVFYRFVPMGSPAEPLFSIVLIDKDTKLYKYYLLERSISNSLMMTSKDHTGIHANYGTVADGNEFMQRAYEYMTEYLNSQKVEDAQKDKEQNIGPWEPTEEQLQFMAKVSGKSNEEIMAHVKSLKLAPDLSHNDNLENKLFKLTCEAVDKLRAYQQLEGSGEALSLIYFSSLLLNLGTSHSNTLNLDLLEDRYFLLLHDKINYCSEIDDVVEYINEWVGKFNELHICRDALNTLGLRYTTKSLHEQLYPNNKRSLNDFDRTLIEIESYLVREAKKCSHNPHMNLSESPHQIVPESIFSLLEFAKMTGKMKVANYNIKEINKDVKICQFVKPEGDYVLAGFSPDLGELTPTEISELKEELEIVKFFSGRYELSKKGEYKIGECEPIHDYDDDELPF